MRLVLILVLCGCASRSKEAPSPTETAVASSLPSNTAPQRPSTPETGRQAAPVAPTTSSGGAPTGPVSPGGPMTAAEAAAHAAAEGASDDSTCASDEDCSFTTFSPSGCCPTLCAPRPVTRKAASALQAQCAGAGCPLPSCAPPRNATVPACEKNRCVARIVRPQ